MLCSGPRLPAGVRGDVLALGVVRFASSQASECELPMAFAPAIVAPLGLETASEVKSLAALLRSRTACASGCSQARARGTSVVDIAAVTRASSCIVTAALAAGGCSVVRSLSTMAQPYPATAAGPKGASAHVATAANAAAAVPEPALLQLTQPLVVFKDNARLFKTYSYVTILAAAATAVLIYKYSDLGTDPVTGASSSPLLLFLGSMTVLVVSIVAGSVYLFPRFITRIRLLPQNQVEISTAGFITAGKTAVYPIEAVVPPYATTSGSKRPFYRVNVISDPVNPSSKLTTYYMQPPIAASAHEAARPYANLFMLNNSVRTQVVRDGRINSDAPAL